MNQYKARVNDLAQGHNTVTLVRLEPTAPRSRVKHSTTEPLRSHNDFKWGIVSRFLNIGPNKPEYTIIRLLLDLIKALFYMLNILYTSTGNQYAVKPS